MRKERIKSTDYTNRDRPDTRLKQFFDIARHNFLEVLKISLLQAIFHMPLIVSLILFYALVRSSGDPNALMTAVLVQGASFLISLPVSYCGMTGTFYCMKKLAYAEGEFASSSFFIGLREEWKKGLFIGLLMGISAGICLIGLFFSYFYLSQFDSVITGFSIAILVTQFIVMLILCYYSMAQIVLYSNQVRYVLKNSFIFTLIRFPINLLLVILAPGIIVALFVIMEITMFVGVGLLIFFSAFIHLIWTLTVIATFDKLINKEKYPELYRKGLADIQPVKED